MREVQVHAGAGSAFAEEHAALGSLITFRVAPSLQAWLFAFSTTPTEAAQGTGTCMHAASCQGVLLPAIGSQAGMQAQRHCPGRC